MDLKLTKQDKDATTNAGAGCPERGDSRGDSVDAMTSPWPEKPIAEVAQYSLGKMLHKSKNKGELHDYLRNVNVRWFGFDLSDIRQMRFEPDEVDKFTAIKGDVLICEGGYPGRAAIWNEDNPIHFQKAVHRVRFHEGWRNKWFLYFLYAEESSGRLRKYFTGTGIQHFTGQALGRLRIPLPSQLEQERIVAILDEAFAGIAAAVAHAEKNLANARELFESCLNSEFENIAVGSEKSRIGDVVSRLTNGYVGPTRNIYQEQGIPYLLARHVRSNRLEFDGKTFVTDEFNQRNKKSILKSGDVLLVQSGHIGHSAVVPESHAGHNCHAMIVLTPRAELIAGAFLSLCLSSPGMQAMFESIRSGSTVPHLTCGAVKELKIPVPALKVQQVLAAKFRSLESSVVELESNYKQKCNSLSELKQSILRKAFAGELTGKAEGGGLRAEGQTGNPHPLDDSRPLPEGEAGEAPSRNGRGRKRGILVR